MPREAGLLLSSALGTWSGSVQSISGRLLQTLRYFYLFLLMQQHLQEQEQYLQQQMQQEELLQEQPQQHNVVLGDETLQIGLPNQSSVSLPLYNDPVMFTQSQPVVPVQLGDEQQPSEYYQDENLGGQEDESCR